MQFDKHFVTQALSKAFIAADFFPKDVRFSVDTRTLQAGDIFIALRGAQCDGHQFVAAAFEKGAAGCIMAQDKENILSMLSESVRANKLIILVPDTLKALVTLASAWREQYQYPVIGITGTVGKTSTKELIAHILDLQGMHYLASQGNQNTLIGVSLNLLRMRVHHQAAIIEMGISKRSEMMALADLVKPTSAVITNIGHQHMDGLGSLLDIALEKRDIFKFFTEDSIGIIHGDQGILADVSYRHPVIKFGLKTTNQIQARKIRFTGSHISLVLKIYGNKYPIIFKKPHVGVVSNALAAVAVARLLHVSDEIIIRAIQQPIVVAGRFEELVAKNGQGIIINDCYNANPESMKAALLAFQHIETKGKKIVILGDMLGLGVNSPFWHRQIGRFLRKVPSLRRLILVGSLVEWVKKTAPVTVSVDIVPTWKEAAVQLEKELGVDSVVLIKGSLDVGLGNLIDQFT